MKVQTLNKTAYEYYIVESESIEDVFAYMEQLGIKVLGIEKQDVEEVKLRLLRVA